MNDLSILIPWVLERIINREYTVETSEGQIESVHLNPRYRELRNSFAVIESALLASMPAENRNAFLALKEEYTEETLIRTMEKLFPGAGEFLGQNLAGATWEELVKWLDSIYSAAWEGEDSWEGIGPRLARLRGMFGTDKDVKLEGYVQLHQPESLRIYIEEKYARELMGLYPKLVRRSVSVKIVKARKVPSDRLHRYLTEATRCFIYGHFLGSLLVCRAAIEATLEELIDPFSTNCAIAYPFVG